MWDGDLYRRRVGLSLKSVVRSSGLEARMVEAEGFLCDAAGGGALLRGVALGAGGLGCRACFR